MLVPSGEDGGCGSKGTMNRAPTGDATIDE
jgi:hypothetical protein